MACPGRDERVSNPRPPTVPVGRSRVCCRLHHRRCRRYCADCHPNRTIRDSMLSDQLSSGACRRHAVETCRRYIGCCSTPSDQSDWPDSNRRPPDPQSGALTKLRHNPFPAGRMVRHPSRRRAVPFLQGRYPAVGGGANLREASLRDPSRASRTPRDTPMPAGALRSLCGPDGGRTRCLRVANATLYRLSYRPVNALPADSLAAGRAARCRIPRQRGANAFGVRVRSIGAFDEPHRGRAGIEPASG